MGSASQRKNGKSGREEMTADQLRKELAQTKQRESELHGALNLTRLDKARLEGALRTQTSLPDHQRFEPAKAVIEVSELSKAFRFPMHKADTFKERLLHPRRQAQMESFQALNSISFTVSEGEFLGIAGPNGSGKSTLLKIMAGIYTADKGTVRTAGRVAPFIELGAGINPELAAFDNVVISGVMMGLEPEVARERFAEIIQFAGLEDFTEMKLKNYSSGMRVRLAFSVMAQVDADLLLIDEVLAVGDAEFREKCLARLHELRTRGTTIVFVTHDMESLTSNCDRAILLEHGNIVLEGNGHEVADRYVFGMLGPTPPETVAR